MLSDREVEMGSFAGVVGRVVIVCFVMVVGACSTVDTPSSTAPVGFERDILAENAPHEGPIAPVVMMASDAAALPPVETGRPGGPGRRIENRFSDEEILRLQDEARTLPGNASIQTAPDSGQRQPMPGVIFESLDFVSAGQNFVPPDPELAVGPNHTISAVNDYLLITDGAGTPLLPPIQFANLFSGVAGCTGLFDPNVLYDEQLDRFVTGIDANTTAYCVAMSQAPDPTLGWYLYSFATVPASSTPDLFDYPHAGIGQDAIYMGANIFNNAGTTFLRADVWAIDKHAMAAGAAMALPVQQTLPLDDTPQPMNAHGWTQGTWPVFGPHHILANAGGSGDIISVWSWSDPFVTNVFALTGTVDLAAASGVSAGYPIDAPQAGGSNVQANDWRVLDCEYRNGDLWMTQNLSCNPGSGVVDCLRWAEIDPVAPTVLQAGVYSSNGEYRIFPDAGVNHCDDMTIGYTKTSAALWPEVWVTGRLGIDPPGLLQPEALLRPGDTVYSTWETPPMRWGDYTGGTSDPDGVRTWYLGEYSKFISGTPAANWGTFVGEFPTDCAVDLTVALTNGVSQVSPGDTITYTITVTNQGRGDAFGAMVADAFPADLTGVNWTCTGQTGPPAAVCSAPSGSGDINLMVDIEMGATVTVTATGTLSPSATGSLVNTATANYAGIIDPAPGDNMDTDTDTIVPDADLEVRVSDGSCYVLPGDSLTYTVTVDNLGPFDAPAASVSDTVPADLTVTGWSCSASGSATCGSASGTGSLTDSPSLTAGDGVIYSVDGDVSAAASGILTYTVGVSAGAGVVDPNPGNDSDSDVNALETPLFCDGFESGGTGFWTPVTP